MTKAKFWRIFVKDVIDFSVICAVSSLLTLTIYALLPSFTSINLSLVFFEQNIELFFANPELLLWFLGLSFGVSIIYFLFGAMLYHSTFGGALMRLTIVDDRSQKLASISQSVRMALGAYVGVLAFFAGPLSAWWLDADTRGPAEKWSGTRLVRKSLL